MAGRKLQLVALVFVAACSCRQQGRDAFEQASVRITVPGEAALGNTQQGCELADQFGRCLGSLRHVLFPDSPGALREGERTFCQLGAKGTCFLVFVPGLEALARHEKARLVEAAWICARRSVPGAEAGEPGRPLAVALRGGAAFASTAVGPPAGSPQVRTAEAVDVSPLYPFFAGPSHTLTSRTRVEAPVAAARVADVQPSRVRGPWASADWRRPHKFCRPGSSAPSPLGHSSGARWQETCGASPGSSEITLTGEGFASPFSRNSVFVGGSKAAIVSGDATHLVVRLHPNVGPGPASVVVRTAPADADDPAAPDRTLAPRGVTVLGPPTVLRIVEGDQHVAPVRSKLQIVAQLTDRRGEGVPGERVWFWTRPISRWHTEPVRSEVITDALGLARLNLELPSTPTAVRIQAEGVNASPRADGPLAVTTATALADPVEVEHLTRGLEAGSPAQQREAARALGELGPTASAAASALLAAARSPDPDLRRSAVAALAAMQRPEAVELYAQALGGESTRDLLWASSGLAGLGTQAKPAVPALARLLRSKNWAVRIEALGALARIGAEAEAAVPELIVVLGDRDARIRRMAVELLHRIGPPAGAAAETALRGIARADAREDVRRAAQAALESLLRDVPRHRLVTRPSGPTQALPGSSLSIGARLDDRDGKPLAFERVYFRVQRGDASVPASGLTDEGGVVRIQVQLGSRPGPVEVVATFEAASASFSLLALR